MLIWGLLAGPIAWLIALEGGYLLTYWACAQARPAAPFLLTGGMAALAVGGMLGAWRALQRSESSSKGDGSLGRRRLVALTALGISVLSVLVILVSAIPLLWLAPCTR